MSTLFNLVVTNPYVSPFWFIDEVWKRKLYFDKEILVLLNYEDYLTLGTHPKNPSNLDFICNSPLEGFSVRGVRFKYQHCVDEPEVENARFEIELEK